MGVPPLPVRLIENSLFLSMKTFFMIGIIMAFLNASCSIGDSRVLESDKIYTVSEALQLYNTNKDFFKNNYILVKSCGVGGLDCVDDCELIIWHVDPENFIPYKNGSRDNQLKIETIITKSGPLNREHKNKLIGNRKCGIYEGYFITQHNEHGEQLRFLVDEIIREEKINKIKLPDHNFKWELPNID